jgi:hypothetical protein
MHAAGLLKSIATRAIPLRERAARRRLESLARRGGLPRIAIVKQDCNEDLYCCPPGLSARETLSSTLLRSGPASLLTEFDAKFYIVRTEPDEECNIWKEKAQALGWAPQEWFEAFRDRIPGRPHGQSKFAVGVDDVPWGEFDIVVSIDVSVPARITERHPSVAWAYYVREIKAPSWRSSFSRPVAGQDLYLSQYFAPLRASTSGHVIDFPYHFQHYGVFDKVFEPERTQARHGVFVEFHTARAASAEQIAALSEFGPVYAPNAADDLFDAGERVPELSMRGRALDALLQSKYHVKWGGRAIFGTAKVEAIAAGCLAVSTAVGDETRFLQSSATTVTGFEAVLEKLRLLESDEGLYQREVARQRRLVDYLCYLRPANDLIDAWQRTVRTKLSRRSKA